MARILHIITGLSTGGAERALFNLLYGGLSGYFNNHVISLTDEGTYGAKIRAIDVPVTALGMRRGLPTPIIFRCFVAAVRKMQPDIIQGWMYHGNLAATLARALVLGSSVLSWNIRHSLYDLGDEKLITRQVVRMNSFFSSAPSVLLYNSCLSRKQHEAFGFAARNGQVIPNGINTRKFVFSKESRERVRLEFDIPRDALVVGHVARLHPMKDHAVFLRAASTIALRYPEVHFLLSGRGVVLANKMLVELISPQVGKRFHLLGERNDVPDLMSAMDIFCLSSWSEGFPNVLGEAMATSRSCITTDVGDSAVLLGDTGLVVPPCEKEALSAGIESLLLMSSEKRNALGRMARVRVEKFYPIEKIVGQYTAVYDKMLSKVP